MRTGSGTKGTRRYDWAMLEVTSDDTPGGHGDGHSALLVRRHRYTGQLSYYRCWTPGPVPLPKLIAIAVVNAYVLAFGAGIITATAIGDLIGRRRMYVLGLAIFTAASVGCALAPDIGALIACRAIEGVGAAIIMPLGLTLLTSAFPAERRGAVIGIWGGVAGLAVASGPLIGGAVTQGLTWHWIFWVNVPVGILAIAGSRLRLAESHGPASRLDLPALVLIAAGGGAVTWGLVQAGQVGWGSAQTLTALSLGAVSIAGFVAWERRAAEPMIPLGLFRSGSFSAAVAAQFLLAAAIYSAAFLTSQCRGMPSCSCYRRVDLRQFPDLR